MPLSHGAGQVMQSAAQVVYGVLSLLAVVTTFWQRRLRRPVLACWALGLTVAGGLAPVVWGDASLAAATATNGSRFWRAAPEQRAILKPMTVGRQHRPQWHRTAATCAFAAVMCACTAATSPRITAEGDYSRFFGDTTLIVATPPGCARYLQYAIASLTGTNRFDISINLFQDCRLSGHGYASWEFLVTGAYSTNDVAVHFAPTSSQTPNFDGTVSVDSLWVYLPARPDSLGAHAILLALGRLPPSN